MNFFFKILIFFVCGSNYRCILADFGLSKRIDQISELQVGDSIRFNIIRWIKEFHLLQGQNILD